MAFWILTAFLTLAASLAVMWPFLRGGGSAAARPEHDLAVYRDQLAELEQEACRGLISETDAVEARAEIGRRILQLRQGETGGTQAVQGRGKLARAVAVVAVLAVPVVSWTLYSILGSPGTPALPLSARLSQDPAQASLDELIARAERHLAANPEDVRGWETLAPIYSRLGRYSDAVAAHRRAIVLAGASSEREAALGEALVGESGGVITAQAEAAFDRALALDGDDPRAKFFIAMARAQEGRGEEARSIWEEMVATLPSVSPWKGAAGQALANFAAVELERQDSGPSPDGPSDQEIAAAVDMTPEARQNVIEGMVAGLDAKLREKPDNPDGWRRLLRSYVVLGQTEQAEQALARALVALDPGSTEARELAKFAATLGIVEEEE